MLLSVNMLSTARVSSVRSVIPSLPYLCVGSLGLNYSGQKASFALPG